MKARKVRKKKELERQRHKGKQAAKAYEHVKQVDT